MTHRTTFRAFTGACAAGALGLAGCTANPGPEGPAPVVADTVVRVDTVVVSGGPDPAIQQQLAVMQLQLLERDAQLEELQVRLDEARREVVRAMAKLQTSATRAEAASAMAEAEVALRQLERVPGTGGDVTQARRLLAEAQGEFDAENYAGALYLANETKSVVSRRRSTATGDDLRPGETTFARPVPLATTARSNVREGPGTGFAVLFTLDDGSRVTGHSYVEQWVRITDDAGRTGWIYQPLVTGR